MLFYYAGILIISAGIIYFGYRLKYQQKKHIFLRILAVLLFVTYIFELFNIEVRILVATNDYNIFFNQLYEDLKETYIDYDYSELEEEEIDEIIEDEPVLELFFYLEKVKSSNEIHNKQHLINKFKEYESTINLDTFSFRF